MSEILKPSNLSLTWAQGGDILNPGDTKYATGWGVEIPPRQWFNYLDNRQDESIAHINQRGIAQWDSTTEYQGVKSYVQGSNGTVYRSKQTNTNQEPVADVSGAGLNWQIAFASAGDFYTKAQSDAAYLARASNLADLANVATARTNLSVYSKAETYTKAETDGKTTVASTAQAQGWTSNTTLITPLKLAEAFMGTNQSFAAIGYQKLPGGLILQWGRQAEGSVGIFPLTFPTTCLSLVASGDVNSFLNDGSVTTVTIISTSQFRVRLGTDNVNFLYWLAIGY